MANYYQPEIEDEDIEFIKKVYPSFVKNEEFWTKKRNNGGLFFYYTEDDKSEMHHKNAKLESVVAAEYTDAEKLEFEKNALTVPTDIKSATTITLPASVTSLGHGVFSACPKVLDVYCFAESVPSTSSIDTFGSDIQNQTLHVPTSALDNYRTTAPWSSFGTILSLAESR